ncbi:Thioredoxin-like fold,Glutathione S-transferase, C-terminal-like,Failed axon connections,Metaxin [Cinara cedri]|uniref:Thioredoxin-like fold,Glutathione S-transferase, C-terminal-like,Failed axon connections,Metaxin n=1 Tax=Cinara cedri TaxID=506608 RepID=A0A5E4MF89_9HEMI|nr:Thioredoxin-like fold,Glutathione S-transferase, C-terminal-like,Failed axon connections,Metaxin [Cinara cedri]
MTTATTEETKNVPQDIKEPVKEVVEPAVEANNKQENEKKPVATAEKDEKESAPAEPPAPKFSVKKQNFEKDVVYLYQFSRTPVIASMSPYCLKVETWLRLVGLKYENIDHKMKYRSKKGQLPFVELNGEEIADSTLIIKELGQKFGKDIDAGLSQEQRNISHAMISMIENKFVWVITWWKTKTPENVIKGYKLNLQHALGTWVPNPLLNFFFKYSYSRRGLKKVKSQGIGVHKPEDILEFGQNDLKVLSEFLGDKLYFFGNEPTTLDVVVFANLAQLYFLEKEVECQLRDYFVDNFENLVEHTNRIKERCFPEWEDMCKNLDLNSHLPKPPPVEEKPKEDVNKKATEKEASKEAEEKDDGKKEGEKEPEDK